MFRRRSRNSCHLAPREMWQFFADSGPWPLDPGLWTLDYTPSRPSPIVNSICREGATPFGAPPHV